MLDNLYDYLYDYLYILEGLVFCVSFYLEFSLTEITAQQYSVLMGLKVIQDLI